MGDRNSPPKYSKSDCRKSSQVDRAAAGIGEEHVAAVLRWRLEALGLRVEVPESDEQIVAVLRENLLLRPKQRREYAPVYR